MISVTRRYRFPAAHVLSTAAFSDADNQRIYGKCANPSGHGHDYGLEVTLAGPVDHKSGAIFPLERLDALVRERILDRLSHRRLNDDPWFQVEVPTAENIALAIERELRPVFEAESRVRLVCVRLLETRRNFFACGELLA